MTYKEAIKWVDNKLCLGRYTPTIHNPFNKDECYEAGMMAIEAIKKQIPKKPIIHISSVYEDNGDWAYDQEWNMCPTCRTRNEVYIGCKYCPECGQKLDWSEVDYDIQRSDRIYR